MSRADDSSQDFQTGAQAPQGTPPQGTPPQGTGVSGAGTTTGAVATGQTTGPTQTTGTTTTRATTDVRDQQEARGAAPAAGYEAGYGYADTGTGAGLIMGGSFAILAGLVTFLVGLSAVVRRNYYHVATNYAYNIHAYDWGWILLVLGVLLFAVGACALIGMGWARYVGVGLAVLSTVAGFLFLPYYPFWGIVVVALSVVAIWGLLSNGGSSRQPV